MPSCRTLKRGDLVRLDPKKYNVFTSQMIGVVSEIDDSSDWRVLSVNWAGDREPTGHLPTDLNLVEEGGRG